MNRYSALIAIALTTLLSQCAFADRITNFQALISNAPDKTLTVKTITTWNGDTDNREQFVFSPTSFVQYECDANWKCQEGKASSRSWHLAFQKPAGFGYILVKVRAEYESTRWEMIELVNEEGARRPLADIKPGCQDLFSDGRQLILVEALQQGYIDPTGPPPDAKATAFDSSSGKATSNPSVDDHAKWKLLARNTCGLRYFE